MTQKLPGSMIQDASVGQAAIGTGAVTSAKILDGTVVTADLADSSVTGAKVSDGSLTGADVQDGALTGADLQDGSIQTADLDPTARPALTAFFESAEQTITAGAAVTVAHGLGAVPRLVMVVARCLTAQAPFAVGDEFHFIGTIMNNASSPRNVAVRANETNVVVQVGESGIMALTTTGTQLALTASNFRLVVRAWR